MRERMLKEFDADGDGELNDEERGKAREARQRRARDGERGDGPRDEGRRGEGRRGREGRDDRGPEGRGPDGPRPGRRGPMVLRQAAPAARMVPASRRIRCGCSRRSTKTRTSSSAPRSLRS